MDDRISFRSVLGGPALGADYLAEIQRIRKILKPMRFGYEIDLLLRIGGDVIRITDATGLHHPRVSVAKHKVTGNILINGEQALASDTPAKLLRTTIHAAVCDIFDRIAARDKEFDADAARAKVAFLAVDSSTLASVALPSVGHLPPSGGRGLACGETKRGGPTKVPPERIWKLPFLNGSYRCGNLGHASSLQQMSNGGDVVLVRLYSISQRECVALWKRGSEGGISSLGKRALHAY